MVRPQWRVTLRTDAPIPDLGDRLLVEITDARGALACTACRRVLDAANASFPLSFGVAELPGPLFVRARLHLARDVDLAGSPLAALTVDARARLPDAPSDVTIALDMRCYGVPSAATETCDPTSGLLGPTPTAALGTGDPAMRPGTFERVPPCGAASPRASEVCVDGGLFLLREAPGLASQAELAQARLLRVSSFYVDRYEVSVGRVRALLLAGRVTEAPLLHVEDGGERQMCTYRGLNDGSADAMPANCLGRSLAKAVCEAEGSRLPRDAELGYVATNGGRGTAFTWGNDRDVCAHAVVGRGRAIIEELPHAVGPQSSDCRGARASLRDALGPVPVELAGADGDVAFGVHGLAGNVSEWVEDDFGSVNEPCWRGRPLVRDPVCITPRHTPAMRGGSWADGTPAASAGLHSPPAVFPGNADNTMGFRCARDL